jgi:AraC-like DNA-binding protein
MKHIYQQVTTAEMATTPATASMDNSLRLMDNIDEPFTLQDEERKSFLNRPIQYISTMSLMVCLQGVTKVNIGLHPYEMQANDSLFLKSGIICEVTDMSEDALFFSIILDESFYYPIFSHLDLSVLQRALLRQPICNLGKEKADECLTAYRQLKKRLLDEQKDVLHHDILKGYLQVLLFNVYAVYLQQDLMEAVKPTRQQELFNRFMELLQRDYRKERNIKHYADKLCITPAYLSRVVLAQSGLTAGEHIDNFIIAEAKQLIKSRQYTILQVSEMLNFTSQSFFGRYFKNHTGYTPLSFQQLT